MTLADCGKSPAGELLAGLAFALGAAAAGFGLPGAAPAGAGSGSAVTVVTGWPYKL